MSKNRVYGNQVIVRLLTNIGNVPVCIDFDEISIKSKTANKTNRSIGKKIDSNQLQSSGYEITLTRSKRDNYIQSLSQFLDNQIHSGFNAVQFKIEHVTEHNYSAIKNVPELEFGRASVGSIPLIGGALNQINQQASQAINGAVNAVQNSPIGGLIVKPFTEKYVYYNCTLSNLSWSDKPFENTVEQITLVSTNRVCESDFNLYEDVYSANNLTNDAVGSKTLFNSPFFDSVNSVINKINSLGF